MSVPNEIGADELTSICSILIRKQLPTGIITSDNSLKAKLVEFISEPERRCLFLQLYTDSRALAEHAVRSSPALLGVRIFNRVLDMFEHFIPFPIPVSMNIIGRLVDGQIERRQRRIVDCHIDNFLHVHITIFSFLFCEILKAPILRHLRRNGMQLAPENPRRYDFYAKEYQGTLLCTKCRRISFAAVTEIAVETRIRNSCINYYDMLMTALFGIPASKIYRHPAFCKRMVMEGFQDNDENHASSQGQLDIEQETTQETVQGPDLKPSARYVYRNVEFRRCLTKLINRTLNRLDFDQEIEFHSETLIGRITSDIRAKLKNFNADLWSKEDRLLFENLKIVILARAKNIYMFEDLDLLDTVSEFASNSGNDVKRLRQRATILVNHNLELIRELQNRIKQRHDNPNFSSCTDPSTFDDHNVNYKDNYDEFDEVGNCENDFVETNENEDGGVMSSPTIKTNGSKYDHCKDSQCDDTKQQKPHEMLMSDLTDYISNRNRNTNQSSSSHETSKSGSQSKSCGD